MLLIGLLVSICCSWNKLCFLTEAGRITLRASFTKTSAQTAMSPTGGELKAALTADGQSCQLKVPERDMYGTLRSQPALEKGEFPY